MPSRSLNCGDRLARAAHVRLLAGDRRELLGGGLEHLRVLLGLADAHVQRDLLRCAAPASASSSRSARSARADLLVVALASGGRASGSWPWSISRSAVPDCAWRRASRLPSSRGDADARRLVVLGVEQHHVGDVDRALLLDHAADGLGALGAGDLLRALVALDDVQALDVDALASSGRRAGRVPVLPRSLPLITTTSSSRRILRAPC